MAGWAASPQHVVLSPAEPSLQGTGDVPCFVQELCVGDLLGMGGFCQLDHVEINTSGTGRQRAPREVSFRGAVKHPQFYWMFLEDFLEAWPPRAALEPWLDFRSVFVVVGAGGAVSVFKHRTRDVGFVLRSLRWVCS